jgi:hypothetical protein
MPTASALLNQANMLYSADNAPPIVAFGKSRNATAGLHTQVVLNDGLGQLSFYGSDGTNFRPGANIRALVNGTPAVNRVPGRLVFATTPAVGSTTPVDRLLLDELGLRPTIDSLCSLGSTALGYAHVFLNGYIEFSEVGFVVPTPAANDLRLYAKDVAGVTHLFHMDSVGTETDLSLTSGDVTGPASSTNNAIPRFVGTGGKTLTSSGVLTSATISATSTAWR